MARDLRFFINQQAAKSLYRTLFRLAGQARDRSTRDAVRQHVRAEFEAHRGETDSERVYTLLAQGNMHIAELKKVVDMTR